MLNNNKIYRSLIVFGVLLQLAFLLPGFFHYGSHPDELGIRLTDMASWDDWRPYNFYYPTTHVYFLKLMTIPIMDVLHFKLGFLKQYDASTFNLFGRAITTFFAVGCSLMAFASARLSGVSRFGALIILVLVSAFPLLNNLARFNTTDVPNLTWIFLTILITIKAANTGSVRWFVLSGISAGLTAGVKYLGVLIWPGLVTALLLNALISKHYLFAAKRATAWVFIACAAFLISTPFILIDPTRFVGDFTFLAKNVPVWNGINAPIGAVGIPAQIVQVVNPVVLLMTLFGIYAAIRNWRKPLCCIIIVSLTTYYLFMLTNRFYPLRFILPLYGMLLFVAGLGIDYLYSQSKNWKTWQRTAGLIIVLCGLGLQIRESAAITYNYIHETRYEAGNWLGPKLSINQRLAYPLDIYTYFPTSFLPQRFTFDSRKIISDNRELQIPGFIAYGMSSSFWQPDKMSAATKFQSYIGSNWKPLKQFEMQSWLGKKPKYTEFLCPTITVYRRPE